MGCKNRSQGGLRKAGNLARLSPMSDRSPGTGSNWPNAVIMEVAWKAVNELNGEFPKEKTRKMSGEFQQGQADQQAGVFGNDR